jgi:serine/threonine protein kinase
VEHLPLPPGSLVGLRYKLLSPIGRGGMGLVYRAVHLALEREVALKIVPPGLGDASATIRFEREARNAARLDHKGCVRVLDVGVTPDGHRFLAMDLLEGPTLRQRLAEGAIEPAEAVRLVAAILDGLAHAHGRGVVHRDVKPENVMLVPSERSEAAGAGGVEPVLIDFGLSWALGDERITRAGTTVGSPSYLAPERALGKDGDHRADLYAAGVILYEMLAGRRPFAAPTAIEVAWMHAHRDAAFLPDVVPGIPLMLASVVHRALVKNPEARWSDAASMRDALLQLQPSGAPAAPPTEQEEEATAVVTERRSWLRALWGRLRFGRWRWRPA